MEKTDAFKKNEIFFLLTYKYVSGKSQHNFCVNTHLLESTLTYTFFLPVVIFRFLLSFSSFVLLFRSLDFQPICCMCVRLSNVLIFFSLWLSCSFKRNLFFFPFSPLSSSSCYGVARNNTHQRKEKELTDDAQEKKKHT